MPGQGPPLFFPDYWPQQNPFMDDHFQPHMNNMQFMGQPFGGNRFQQMRGPIWGQNFQQNRNHYWHNHNYRGNNHSGCHRATRHSNTEPEKICFICQDALQNSAERGVHLCDGGATVQKESTKDDSTPENYNVDLSDMDARLETLLNELKDCLRNKYESVTETLEKYVSSRVDEISAIHKDVLEDKTHLEKLRLQLESKSTELQQKEKSLRDKESQFKKDRQKYDKEIHEEKEEICRQWQELRDEIARMEKLHEVQKVYRMCKELGLDKG